MKKIIYCLLIITFLFSFAACSSVPKKSSEPLSIGVLPDVDSIPLIIAQQNGYFEKQGVNVKIEHFKGAPDRDSALQAGKIDGAVSDILAAAFSKEGGFDVRITSMTNGSYKLLVGKDSNVSSLADIKGKSIAISKNTIIEYATDKMLEESGIKPEDINKVVIPKIPVRLEMLQNGKVAAATLPDPLATVAMKDGAVLLSSSDKLGINPGILLFTKKSIDTKAEEMKAFYRAYNQAVEYLQKEDTAKYIDILIKEAGFPEAVKGSITLPVYTKAALPSEKDFNNVIDWLTGKTLIKTTFKFSDLVEDKFVR